MEKDAQQPLDVEELLSELSIKVERVKVLYEQYFMGIEKIEPLVSRKDVQRTMLMLQQLYIRNTGLRFKFNTLLQKWNIYITYWNRILREIENGTYVRHLVKAQRQAAREGKAIPDELLRGAKVRPPSGTFDTGAAPEKAFLDLDSEPNLMSPRKQARQSDDAPDTAPGFELETVQPTTPPRGAGTVPADPLATKPPAGARALAPPLPPPIPVDARRSPSSPPGSRPPPPSSASPSRPPGAPSQPPGSSSATTPGPPASASRPPGSSPASRPPGVAPASASQPPAARPASRPPAAAPIPGMDESELRALHQKYVSARKQSGENVNVSYETLVNSLAKQVPAVLKQPGVTSVKFDVTVQNGKAVLKAIPRKG